MAGDGLRGEEDESPNGDVGGDGGRVLSVEEDLEESSEDEPPKRPPNAMMRVDGRGVLT